MYVHANRACGVSLFDKHELWLSHQSEAVITLRQNLFNVGNVYLSANSTLKTLPRPALDPTDYI